MAAVKRAIPELALDTQLLEEQLRGVPVGDVLTYREMSTLIGRDVQTVARHHLVTARRRLLRAQIVFEPVRNEGMKRLDDVGKIGAGRWHLTRARRQARYAIQKTTAVDHFEALTNEQRTEHNIIVAQAGTLRHFTSERTAKRLKQTMQNETPVAQLSESLKAMKPLV